MTPVLLRSTCLIAVLTSAWSASAQEETRPAFSGPYLALDVSRQNTIAGALVAGTDILAQESRNVGSFSAGYRHRLGGGLVLGLEASFGITDGDLRYRDTVNGLSIDYKNSTQYAFGGTVGYAFDTGGATLIYAYVSETKRSFDVTVRGPLGVGSQRDKQGLLRYGLGLERRVGENLGVRASLGSSRADFGDRRKNIEPKTQLDFSLGAVWQF